jgi:hypothetical protein
MLNRELLKKVKKIELSTRHLVNEVFGGEYHSVFKGRGMEFAEVREYMPGDEIRTIDWNVSARTGVPYVKLFEEERELTVMLWHFLPSKTTTRSACSSLLMKWRNSYPPEKANLMSCA